MVLDTWSTLRRFCTASATGIDQLGRLRRDDDAAEHRAVALAAEELDEAVGDALHLGARVARERQHDRLDVG